MNLSFAKDSKVYSQAVEELRKESIPMTEENIKERYEQIAKSGASKKADAPANASADATVGAAAKPAKKAAAKKAAKA